MNQVQDLFDDIDQFEGLLDLAEQQASTAFEMQFLEELRERFDRFCGHAYLSLKQLNVLEDIAS